MMMMMTTNSTMATNMATKSTTAPSSTSTVASTLTDCSSMQGSTTSSASSDVMTLTTTAASSWCAIPASSRLRVLRLVRPHQRRLLVVPGERSATFGFAVRGGKEYGTGFFVSHVEHGGEAQLKGLRIGDQILRINGFRLDDAVHKEFIQLVASQDRVILKVRGVGMLPVKDQVDERLSWNVVKMPSVSGTPSESSFKTCNVMERRAASRDINVVLHVAPRTKLGLGICKGPEWKPGIFIQFTKERSVAREAGLRPGDQILSVNSIDFSDVLFSEAVAVMKSASKLDMIVRTAAGCDLFPGESSGYNSSASSVTGDQSPCWADPKSKRLTAVHEEPPIQGWVHGMEVHKQLNKTIIKLSENGTSINNTYIASNVTAPKTTYGPTGAPTPPPLQMDLQRIQRTQSTSMSRAHGSSTSNRSTIKRNIPRPVTSQPPPRSPPKSPPAAPKTTTATTATATAAAATEAIKSETCAGSTLSSAINEELKKRKEKQKQQQQQQHQQQQHQQQRNNHNSHFNRERDRDEDRPHNHNSSHHNIIGGAGNSLAVARQVSHKQRSSTAVAGIAAASHGSECKSNGAGGDQHTALMDEFKRAHQRMFRNGFHESEHKQRGETLKRTSIMPDDSCYRSNNTSSSNNNNNNSNNSRQLLLNGGASNNNNNNNNGIPELPPPPPEFANPQPPQAPQQLNGVSKASQQASSPSPLSPTRNVAPSVTVGGLRAPATPRPDYDAVQRRPGSGQNGGQNGAQNGNQRRTLRLGTVTIGEYSEQRGANGKRDTLQRTTLKKTPSNAQQHQLLGSNYESGTPNGAPIGNGILKNGGRSSASFSRQHTEKSIKFGN
ncbi:uncharacterized protein LOC115628900 [Scaptodrosophila lebanonensis]|uniref:Uncharacterized protein LOC115628900 n=1 Tax=Drosophila lebanonensis TaxID=7225 RepID=A0A6J2TY13_DROLE|nr:uncharacterized protein LOC115628900 [Scaptodrosophila lebanonensis]